MKLYQKLFVFFLSPFYKLFVRIYLKIKGIKVSRIEYQKEPKCSHFVVIANHNSLLDSFIIDTSTSKYISYLVTKPRSKLFNLFINLVGFTPRNIFKTDLYSIKLLYNKIQKKTTLGLYPEGNISWDGETAHFDFTTVKILKRIFNTPLRIVKITGMYLVSPRWANRKRSGEVLVEYYTINKKEFDELSPEELYDRIRTYIYCNNVKCVQTKELKYSGKYLSSGIEKFLWLCPECYSHNTINPIRKSNSFICSHCDAKWELDAFMKVTTNNDKHTIADLKDWSDWQRQEIKNSLLSTDDNNSRLTITKDIVLYYQRNFKLSNHSAGDLILYPSHIEFRSKNEDKDDLRFDVSNIRYQNVDIDNYFSFVDTKKDEIIVILFKNKNAVKWLNFLNIMQELEEDNDKIRISEKDI